jgi:hypothetical protein
VKSDLGRLDFERESGCIQGMFLYISDMPFAIFSFYYLRQVLLSYRPTSQSILQQFASDSDHKSIHHDGFPQICQVRYLRSDLQNPQWSRYQSLHHDSQERIHWQTPNHCQIPRRWFRTFPCSAQLRTVLTSPSALELPCFLTGLRNGHWTIA